jgi:hypothetical protein
MRTIILWLVAILTSTWGCGAGAEIPESGGAVLSDIFVDSTNGSDEAAGTEDAPLKTLKAALSMAESPQTVWLQNGIYGEETGEDWSVPVPNGVNISAVAPGDAVLVGPGPFSDSDAVALDLAGDGEVRGLRIEGFPCAVRAAQGRQLVGHVEMYGNRQGFRLSGSAKMTCVECDVFEVLEGFHLEDASSLKLDRTEVGNFSKECGPHQLGSATGAASLWMARSYVHGAFHGISLRGAAVGYVFDSTIGNTAVESEKGSCGAGLFELMDSPKLYVSNSFLTNATEAGVLSHGDAGEVTLVDSTIRAMAGGEGIVGVKKLTMQSCTLTGTHEGYSGVQVGHGSLDMTDTTIAGFEHGILMQHSATVRARSSYLGGETAILLFGGSLDLGVLEEPGLNNLAQANETALALFTQQPVTVQASGNVWIKNCQGSSSGGTYAKGKEIAGPFGGGDPAPRNLWISKPGSKVVF